MGPVRRVPRRFEQYWPRIYYRAWWIDVRQTVPNAMQRAELGHQFLKFWTRTTDVDTGCDSITAAAYRIGDLISEVADDYGLPVPLLPGPLIGVGRRCASACRSVGGGLTETPIPMRVYVPLLEFNPGSEV